VPAIAPAARLVTTSVATARASEAFSTKWLRLAEADAVRGKARADSTGVETALEHGVSDAFERLDGPAVAWVERESALEVNAGLGTMPGPAIDRPSLP
jgi:hypothetical protein